ncbi:MAG: OmpA family protein [Prevotella sp.]|nr:OmpA family protein [Prevotella sp.]
MKKLFLMLAAATFAANVSAQTVEESKTFFDNWYIGVNAGVSAPSTGYKVFKNISLPEASLRIGRWITPVFGFAAEGTVNFGNKPEISMYDKVKGQWYDNKTAVNNLRVSLLGTTNFSNWFAGYKGEPRTIEFIGVYGLGWQHVFGGYKKKDGYKCNFWAAKLGMDIAFNLGAAKAWQVYLEPNIVYNLETNHGVQFDFRQSMFGVNVGVNYKFGNSNGTHNFKIAQLRDQAEIDGLNAQINQLRSESASKDSKIAADARTIQDLQNQLNACRNQPKPTAAVAAVKENVALQPIVIFRQGKSTIDAAQYANIEMVAKYMKNHKDAKLLVKGYASPEGTKEINQKLSEQRAIAVKNALVKKYKIAADRIETKGFGATSELSEENDFNRVAMFFDTNNK